MSRRSLVSLVFILALAAGLLAASLAVGNRPLLGLDLKGGVEVVLVPEDDPDRPVAITQGDLRQARLGKETNGELVNYLVEVDEAKVAVVFKELPRAVKVSLRAKPGYDVGRLGAALGGGGHVLAAGCTLAGTLAQARERVLPLARELIAAGDSL